MQEKARKGVKKKKKKIMSEKKQQMQAEKPCWPKPGEE